MFTKKDMISALAGGVLVGYILGFVICSIITEYRQPLKSRQKAEVKVSPEAVEIAPALGGAGVLPAHSYTVEPVQIGNLPTTATQMKATDNIAEPEWWMVVGKAEQIGQTGMYLVPIAKPSNKLGLEPPFRSPVKLAMPSGHALERVREGTHLIGELLTGESKLEARVYPWKLDGQDQYMIVDFRRK